jgi:hypothetical protein
VGGWVTPRAGRETHGPHRLRDWASWMHHEREWAQRVYDVSITVAPGAVASVGS